MNTQRSRKDPLSSQEVLRMRRLADSMDFEDTWHVSQRDFFTHFFVTLAKGVLVFLAALVVMGLAQYFFN